MTDSIPIPPIKNSIANTLTALADWNQRAILFGESVSSISPESASKSFNQIIASAINPKTATATIVAQSAFLSILRNFWPATHIVHTREAAAGQEDEITSAFLVIPEYPNPNEETFNVPSYSNDRALTLGERRSLATTPDRKSIELAMRDPHPMVAAKLLSNPKTTENDIIRIASKTPAPSSVLVEIAVHTKWRERKRVCKALVNNKYLPACFGLTVLPFLDIYSLQEAAYDGRLDQDIRHGANLLFNHR